MPDIVSTPDQNSPEESLQRTLARTIDSRHDDPAQAGIRIALVVAIASFALLGILLVGIVGFRAGFAPAMGVPTLTQTMGEAFSRGLLLPVALLEAIYTTGVRAPLIFTGALIIMLPPIAAIVIAKPRTPGTAPFRQEARVAAAIGGGLIVIADIIIAVRMASASRGILDAPFGRDVAEFTPWIEAMEGLAAKDSIALVVAILLAVLAFRLPIERWARAVVGTIAIATCIIAAAATAASGGTMAGLDEPRSLLWANPGTSLLLGTTDTNLDAVIGWNPVNSNTLEHVRLQPPTHTKILGPKSLRQFVTSKADQ